LPQGFVKRHHEKALKLDPNFLIANTYVALSLTGSGRYDEAIDIMRRVEPLAGEHAYTLAAFGEAYAMAGQRDEARRMLDQLDELARESRARTSGSKVRGTSRPARQLI
jgi:tetratricopeptide (TPR) repeat protein